MTPERPEHRPHNNYHKKYGADGFICIAVFTAYCKIKRTKQENYQSAIINRRLMLTPLKSGAGLRLTRHNPESTLDSPEKNRLT